MKMGEVLIIDNNGTRQLPNEYPIEDDMVIARAELLRLRWQIVGLQDEVKRLKAMITHLQLAQRRLRE